MHPPSPTHCAETFQINITVAKLTPPLPTSTSGKPYMLSYGMQFALYRKA